LWTKRSMGASHRAHYPSSLLKNLEISPFSLPRHQVSGDVFDRV
jgi:hypothetical protein